MEKLPPGDNTKKMGLCEMINGKIRGLVEG